MLFRSVRRELIQGAEIPHHEEIEGRDGVKQPAHKAIKTTFIPEPDNEREYMLGAKVLRAEKQAKSHADRLENLRQIEHDGRPSAPGKISKKFPVIYADPPWRFGVRDEVTGREKSAENHYPTMDTDAVCELFGEIGNPSARDCVLFLWATNPMLIDGLRVMEAWGFRYVHHWVWDKEVAGTGYWGRDRHEILLIGKRGKIPAPLPGTQPETVHRERKGKHSAKPDFYAETIERLYPDMPRLEMFCRSPRPGWDAWGYEAAKANDDAPDNYSAAVAVVQSTGKASTSLIQRRLKIGYNQAASLIDRMERDGIVGPADAAGKREILQVPA